jgi:hypothetical protein
MKHIVPVRFVFITSATVLVGAVATTSCDNSQKRSETANEEQERMQSGQPYERQEPSTARAYGPMEPGNQGEATQPTEPGAAQPENRERFRSGASGTMVEPSEGTADNPRFDPGEQPAAGGGGEGAPATPPMPARGNERGDVHQLTVARCQREARCNNIGKNKKYESSDQCIRTLDARGYTDLGPDECKSGIRRDKVEGCLSAIRNEQCNSPLDTLRRLVSCQSAALCAD